MDDEARSAQLFADLARAHRELLDTYAANFEGRAIRYPHLYMYWIARRALAQSRAFKRSSHGMFSQLR